ARASRARILAKIHFLYRPQSDRDSLWPVRTRVLIRRFLPDDDDALATGLSRPGDAGDRQVAAADLRARFDAGRENDARLLQLVRRDARHDYDFCRRRAARLR